MRREKSVLLLLVVSGKCYGFSQRTVRLWPQRTRDFRQRVEFLQLEASFLGETETWDTPIVDPKTVRVENLPVRTRSVPQLHLDSFVLAKAAFVGVMTGLAVSLFKLSIEALKQLFYAPHRSQMLLPLIPAFGGLAVGMLRHMGDFSPGMKEIVTEVDNEILLSTDEDNSKKHDHFRCFRKSLGSIFTLGTGCSLGPEGPSVELGMAMSRLALNWFPLELKFGSTGSRRQRIERRRMVLSCGAAAGVAAGFNAPLTGVCFALEIVHALFPPFELASNEQLEENDNATDVNMRNVGAILLSSVTSTLIARALLGNHLHWIVANGYKMKTPLLELPMYLALGAVSGSVAFAFRRTVASANSFFKSTRMRNIPKVFCPVMGGLFCGIIGLLFPQVLFFGYETLNSLLSNSSLPTNLLLSLLLVKILATAVSAGSGLVGGLFAPSLFLGAMVGASFHNILGSLFPCQAALFGLPVFELADVPAYSMCGAASMLAAVFRAPLTSILLLFELTRDYDILLPVMASAGVAAVIHDNIYSTRNQGTPQNPQ